MLLQLVISNVAIIDKVSIEFGDGLNVLTGETGAGKSIVIDSINAILGERISKELVRTGADKASVEAIFQISADKFEDIFESLGIEAEEDGTLIIQREFNTSGKNICRVNGVLTTVSILKNIGQRLIDVHGQHDNQSLLRTESHINLLDLFSGDKLLTLKKDYDSFLEEYRLKKSKLKEVSGDKNDRERKIDLLKYQIDEIKKAKLKADEEETLEKKRLIMANSEKIINGLNGAYDSLFGGTNSKSSASDYLNSALKDLSNLVAYDSKFSELTSKIEDIYYQMEDVIENIRSHRDETEFEPEILEQIDERIDLIFKLKRKYGATIKDILNYKIKIENELEEIINSEEIALKLESDILAIKKTLFDIAKKMHAERSLAASLLEERIGNELFDLEMKGTNLKVNLEFNEIADFEKEVNFGANGLDKVEFLISTNAGEPLKPLSKIASGGEMSRIMLAIKNILAKVDQVPTLIFDEIDIGISGRAAEKVGEKLVLISRKHQVLCVTHLAQLAAMADCHYLIEKNSSDGATRTSVDKLDEKGRNEEVARIIGGSKISEITIKHAEEMIKHANSLKFN